MEELAKGSTVVMIAGWVAVLTLLLACVLLTLIVILRMRAQRREQRDLQAREHWTRVLQQALLGPVEVQRLQPGEVQGFVDAWNALHESLPEEAARRLVPVGQRVGLEEVSPRLLRGSYHDRAMTIIALGHLRDRRLFDRLSPFLTDRSPIVSLCAARALAQVDPPRAMAMFVPLVAEREDWVPGNVARILAENKDGSAARELGNALLRANADTTVKLVRFLADIDPQRASGVLRQLVNDRHERERVIGFLAASRWHVRMHAAVALGRIGEAADAARLEPLLADSVWWVRYRAAQALMALSGNGVEAMRKVQQRQGDAFGRDIIDQVLSEHGLRGAT